ncbi:MAG TPA: response regulator [Oligoflexus sp.]|uniref:response regulator n=1 Tax=Oligoflexus sp. TaxID=1971216 RepID=UPI002D4DB81C|nr:response regulator [Oligoflexus sp.]HYX37917.1 response regulator [Oligoflexus sp.]
MERSKALLLIADDEEMNKAILGRRLRREGFVTIDVADGSEAVEKIREMALSGMPDLVLMDINMPVMDGIEATRILKAEFENLPIIAVTACMVTSTDFSHYGFNELCTKPIDFNELISKIDKHLSRKA